MRIFIIGFLCALTFTASAADRSATIRALMDAQGLLQIWDQQMALTRQQSRQQAQQLLDQVMESLNPTPDFAARFSDAFDEYMEAVATPWTAQDAVDVWAQKYGARFTDQELDDLLAYYTSPLGKKDVAATQAAMPEWVGHFTQLATPITERAAQAYIQRLQKAAQDCKCTKK